MNYIENSKSNARINIIARYFISLLFFGALILLFYRCPFKMITGIDCR